MATILENSVIFASIVIPTRNRCQLMQKCVESVKKAIAAARMPSEIIIIDDGSTDETKAVGIAIKGNDFAQVRFVSNAINKGPGGARNQGIAMARGEVVGFMDDDMFCDDRWLLKLRECFLDPRIGGVQGKVLVPEEMRLAIRPLTHQTEFHGPPAFGAGNIFYRTELVKKLHGFNEGYYSQRLHIHFREDTDLAFKVLSAGYEMGFSHEMVAYHPPIPGSLAQAFKLERRYYQDSLLFFYFPRLYLRFIVGPSNYREVIRRLIHLAFVLSVIAVIVTQGYQGMVILLAILGMNTYFFYRKGRGGGPVFYPGWLKDLCYCVLLATIAPFISCIYFIRGIPRSLYRAFLRPGVAHD